MGYEKEKALDQTDMTRILAITMVPWATHGKGHGLLTLLL